MAGGVNMEQLLVREYHDHNCGMIGCAVVSERPATDAEVLAAAATLDGAEVLQAEITPAGCIEDYWNLDVDDLERARWKVSEPGHPGRYLVIPLPDKETPGMTDEQV